MKTLWNSQVAEIDIDNIQVADENVRDYEKTKGLEDLESSILVTNGILQPIVVYSVGPDQYRILIGQRRYLAWKNQRATLGKKIPCLIIKPPKNYATGLAWSAIENLQRRDISSAERSTAITELLHHLGTPKKVAQALGLKEESIARWLKYDEIVPEEIKEFVNKKKLTRDQALQLVAVNYPNNDRAIELASILARKKTTGYQRDRVIRRSKKDKKAKAEKIVEEELPRGYDVKITFHLNDEYADGIRKAAKQRSSTANEAAKIILEEYLDDQELTKIS